MKKVLGLCAMLLSSATFTYAQTESQPVADANRLVITSTTGDISGYDLPKIEELSFAKVEGVIAAEVSVSDVTTTSLKVAVTRSAQCESYKIGVVSKVLADAYGDRLGDYINSNKDSSTKYYQDFTAADMTGIDLEYSTKYVVATVAFDKYGVMGEVRKAEVTTPSRPLVGNPQITAKATDVQLKEFTIEFTPNSDVSTYYCVAGEKGTMEDQLAMFGPWFGLNSMTDLIIAWGVEREGVTSHTWTNESPNTTYEVFYVALDSEGTPAEYQVLEVTTLSLGGTGEASVTITPGEYKLQDWYGEQLPSQFFTFTPNDQVAAYRFNVVLADLYDQDQEGYNADLCSEPFMAGMANWFFYDEITTDYQIDPNTSVVALAAGKNANGEWGPVTALRYTTPESAGEASAPRKSASKANNIMTRLNASKEMRQFNQGTIPQLRQNKVTLK